MGALEKLLMTEKDFLEFERESTEKHQFIKGEVFAMSGASIPHNVIAINVTGEVINKLKGKKCRPFGSDLRIYNPASSQYTYPDLSIICGKIETTDDKFDTVTNPTVLFEILSPSTRNYDLGSKFELYRQIPSLKNYVTIDSQAISVILWTKNDDKSWLMIEKKSLDESIFIESIDVLLKLSSIYEEVNLDKSLDA
jgi:Uma2 family endonuclease